MLNIKKKLSAVFAAVMMTATLAIPANAATVNESNTKTNDYLVAQSTVSTKSVSLPLAQYPDGSYYSLTGKACTCHGGSLGNPCYWDNSCDCINFENSIQCAGFAKYVYYLVNGTHTYSNSKTYKNLNLTATTAKNTLQSLPVGTYLRVQTSNGYDHSIAIAGTSSTGITIYHANYGGPCKVRYQTVTWASFANSFDYLYYYIA